MGEHSTPATQSAAARIAGWTLLLLMVSGFTGMLAFGASPIIPGDAAATAQNMLTHERAYRGSLACGIVMLNCDVVLALALYALQQAIQYFGDNENCRRFMVFVRWPDGVPTCPYCGASKLTWLAKANVHRCYGDHLKQKFSLKVGTVFEDSPIGLDKWLPAVG